MRAQAIDRQHDFPPGPVWSFSTTTNYSTSDYNAFGLNHASQYNFEWNSPSFDVAADYDYTHKPIVREFKTLQEYSEATGQDEHSILVDYDVFVNVPKADGADPQRLYNPEDMDFQLRQHSPAIDAGVELPTINDDYSGRAPDLGAYEVGRPLPHYGPRSSPPGTEPLDKVGFRSWNGPPVAPGNR
jgi:hypothetical protein